MTMTRFGDNPKMMIYQYLSKRLLFLLPFTILIALTACGGGGGGGGGTAPQAQKVTATLGLLGSASTTVGSVDIDVVLPYGFVLETDTATGLPLDTVLTLLVPGATFAPNYIPETASANGGIKAGIIKSDGFAGNASLVQLTHTFAAGATLPTADDFIVTVVASDLNGVPLGITEQISISTQPAL